MSAWYTNRLQANMTNILAENVTSLRAAQQLEITVRQLRFHCFLYLIAPDPELLLMIEADHELFETWMVEAERTATTPKEQILVQHIRAGYEQYRQEFDPVRRQVQEDGPQRDPMAVARAHPVRPIINPCREYLRVNEELMAQTAQESSLLSQRLHLTLFLVGLVGPFGGILSGYGIARGLSQSLYRLSVRMQDMALHLEQDVADVRLIPNGDLGHLDDQLEHVVRRVAEVGEQMQQHQRAILRSQQLAAVGQLAASIAHEVRNPLTSIKLLVEASLRAHKPKPFTPENLKVIHGEILRLEQTVQAFLDFARPPALKRRPFDVREVVNQAVGLVRARAAQQKVEVDVRCPPAPAIGEIDPGQLCTVLVNLLINALDAMPAGGYLEIGLDRGSDSTMSVMVADTGIGIGPQIKDQLFTPFVSTKPTGSGLGLSICKHIIEEHGGAFSATNRPEGGARFTFTLPQTLNGENHAEALSNR